MITLKKSEWRGEKKSAEAQPQLIYIYIYILFIIAHEKTPHLIEEDVMCIIICDWFYSQHLLFIPTLFFSVVSNGSPEMHAFCSFLCLRRGTQLNMCFLWKPPCHTGLVQDHKLEKQEGGGWGVALQRVPWLVCHVRAKSIVELHCGLAHPRIFFKKKNSQLSVCLSVTGRFIHKNKNIYRPLLRSLDIKLSFQCELY